MPGIFGIIEAAPSGKGRHPDLAALTRAMAASMLYEPSYAAEFVACPVPDACVGRVDFAHDQASGFASSDQDVVMVATGERAPRDLAGCFASGSVPVARTASMRLGAGLGDRVVRS